MKSHQEEKEGGRGMITKMKKLTFLVYHKEYEAFLAQIRELGVVHVVERQCGEMDDTLQQFMQKRTLYKNMLQSMYTLVDKQPEEKVHKELSADALVKSYEDLQARIQDLNQQIPAIDKDVAQMEAWVISIGNPSAGWKMPAGSCSSTPARRKTITKRGQRTTMPSW